MFYKYIKKLILVNLFVGSNLLFGNQLKQNISTSVLIIHLKDNTYFYIKSDKKANLIEIVDYGYSYINSEGKTPPRPLLIPNMYKVNISLPVNKYVLFRIVNLHKVSKLLSYSLKTNLGSPNIDIINIAKP